MGGTKLYWPAVQCYNKAIIRLEAAWRHRLTCAGEAASSLIMAPWSVIDDDKRRQTPKSKILLASYTMCRRANNNTMGER